ncbi:hypothetical protein B0J11DRAFT_511008 [Dendryphion nanum]|uniref:Zn(2)-C6 fungal-type domain-containing protein n=1 Tax=Dendryphion nanum TaxID=256645 RepID=A0A9P9D7R5_9PLEO|nr:hypothetical protein B0J11DRAFT_511008 [Dendryphion nanum]
MSSTWTNFSVSAHDDGPHIISEDVPACASCRKRKLRCSREQPTCSHCERLVISCVYEAKQKPGLKLGAVEALTRRVAFLEQILLDDSGHIRSQFDHEDVAGERGQGRHVSEQRDSVYERTNSEVQPSPIEPHPYARTQHSQEGDDGINPRKRKLDQPSLATSLLDLDLLSVTDHLPSQPLLLKIVDHFCGTFHHWIPYLHKGRLRKRVCDNEHNPFHDLVLHALVAGTLRHLDRNVSFLDDDQIVHQSRVSRYIVETFAMRDVSLESLQALIIIVFDYLNSGHPKKAWPLIGSLTRTVDYLQLTLEPSASQVGALMNPLKLVPPTDDWTRLEERRRLFWVIFLLDRYCSVSTGWNTSLTAEDVHRRLPADGGYFTREEPVTTPYFGLWNKASARIGRSLAHVPAQYNEDDPAVEQVQGCSPGSANGLIDSSKLGAFAYCIEATESMSQVTTFFLQQRINWQDKEHAINWLTRFKELDLRLVQWKLFLPPRWKDSNISSDIEVVDMDPNLTLAHITHNTSMILLHHTIAYPTKGWNDYIALPKECSVQTCELAAVEVANIVDKFITHRERIVFVNVQFAFCAFIAAKALLFEHQVTRKPIRPEFQGLIRSLWEMSARWRGNASVTRHDHSTMDQPSTYALHLDYLFESCRHDPHLRFDLYDHSCQKLDINTTRTPSQAWTPQHRRQSSTATNPGSNVNPVSSTPVPTSGVSNLPTVIYGANALSQSPTTYQPSQQSPTSMAPPYRHPPGFLSPNQPGFTNPPQNHPVLPGAPPNTQLRSVNGNNSTSGNNAIQDENLLSLSDAFMDSRFLDLDRVITFEEANFFLPGDGGFRWT